MAKMYYTEEEAAGKLGIDLEALDAFANEKGLQAYRDGNRKMFKAADVDALAPEETTSGEIELAPADTTEGDLISLADTGKGEAATKEDTVITAEGISIFDDEDLEIESADPMAKTQIAPSLEEQLSGDSVGGGSGLLDLTRESDDTSFGPDVLGQIDMEGAIGSSLAAEAITEPEAGEIRPEAPPAEPVVVEAIDPGAGLFSGMLVGGSVVMLLLGAVMLAAMVGLVPGYLELMWKNLLIVVIGAVVVVGVGAVAGFFVGKSAAARQIAMRHAGEAV